MDSLTQQSCEERGVTTTAATASDTAQVADDLSPRAAGRQSVLLDTDGKLGGTAKPQGALGTGEEAREGNLSAMAAATRPAGGGGRGGGGIAGVSVGASGRLSSLAPTLERMATVAHKMSAPYLSYAAQASQEAARFV